MTEPVELWGQEAQHKAAVLRKVRRDKLTGEIYYRDEQGELWIMDFPQDEDGPARLKKIDDIPFA